MGFEVQVTGPLAGVFPAGSLHSAWLNGEPAFGSSSAASELARVRESSKRDDVAPLWRQNIFADKLPKRMQGLKTGPNVVVTGQQPGFLGGPLLTIYKIATAVELAKRLSATDQPTVPVFWSGDDDDDLAEALAPCGWNTNLSQLWRSPARDRLNETTTQRAVLSDVAPEVWAVPVLSALQGNESGCDNVVARLLQVLQSSIDSDKTWGIGQADLIESIFSETDLVIIRGNDERLHDIASPFYEKVWESRPKLMQLATEEGVALRNAGYHAQINERSLANSLFEIKDSKRNRLSIDAPKPETWLNVRPGVMLRSLVQDWLLEPSGVVVGPSEQAYLRQLVPVYEAMEVPRCPLVPRLSAWISPPSSDSNNKLAHAMEMVKAESTTADPQINALSDEIVAAAQKKMHDVLVDDLQVPEERAVSMSEARSRRFRKGVLAMLSDESKRQRATSLSDLPPWIAPHGQSQERALGWLSALDIWGGGLVPAILNTAGLHLDGGAENSWQQFAIVAKNGKVSW
ncbi:MAG: hypothetical protein ACI9UK_000262 [Candidatus Krumholzibacteriia bacterium]|jgi:uncharacterized protein YllA (UPF0747 family)